MATSKELRAWVAASKLWANSMDAADVRERLLQLVAELGRLAEREEVVERQIV